MIACYWFILVSKDSDLGAHIRGPQDLLWTVLLGQVESLRSPGVPCLFYGATLSRNTEVGAHFAQDIGGDIHTRDITMMNCPFAGPHQRQVGSVHARPLAVAESLGRHEALVTALERDIFRQRSATAKAQVCRHAQHGQSQRPAPVMQESSTLHATRFEDKMALMQGTSRN